MITVEAKETLNINPETAGSAIGSANAAELKVLLEVSAISKVPLMIVGEAGVGKTAIIEEFSRKNGYGRPITIIGSQLDPTDVAGLPYPGKDDVSGRECTKFLPPVMQTQALDGKPHVVFFDEFSNTPRSVQAALLKLIGEHRFPNGEKIPDNCVIVGAMNPAVVAVDYTPISKPMANRLMFVSYRPTVEEVCEGLTGGWYDPEEYAALSVSEREWRNRVAAFIRKNPEYMLRQNGVNMTDTAAEVYGLDDDESEREILMLAWASPRSWDNVCRALGTLPITDIVVPIQERILNGTIGREAQIPFSDFIQTRARVDTNTIIRDPSIIDWTGCDGKYTTNDIVGMANTVASVIPECDGMNGRPTPDEALALFEQVSAIDEETGEAVIPGAAAIFAQYFIGNGSCRAAIEHNRPSNILQREWTARVMNVLKNFKAMEVIKGENR